MKDMSFVSLMNILISTVEEKETTKEATQEDIDRVFGQEEIMATSTWNILIICLSLIIFEWINKRGGRK